MARTIALILMVLVVGLAATPAVAREVDEKTFDEYFERFDAVENADGHAELSVWCREKGLSAQAEMHLRAALRLDPDHAHARELAGYVEYKGPIDRYSRQRWLDEKTLAEAQAAEIERERAEEARLEERANDPYTAEVDRILERISGDPYLKDKNLVPSEDYRPFLLLVERGTPFHFNQIGTVLVAFHEYFRDEFGTLFDLPKVTGPLVIIAWRDRKGYDDYCEHLEGVKPMRSRAAHYSPVSHEIVVHGWDSLRANPYRPVIDSGIFTHEATHQLIHYYSSKISGNPNASSNVHWFQEGIAEYCGNLRITKRSRKTGEVRYLFGERSASRASELRGALAAEDPVYFKLEEMLSIRDKREMHAAARRMAPEDWQSLTSLFYAQAWTFVYFLKEQDEGKRFWQKFLAVMKAELEDESNPIAARKTLGIEDVEALEKEWLEWFQESF